MEKVSYILGFAKRFFAGTLLSRISGALRDIAMAYFFGASVEIAAFMVAYRLANLFRRLLGEGALQAAFTPEYSMLQREDPKRAALFYRNLSFSLVGIVLAVLFVFEGALWLSQGYVSLAWQEIFRLTIWMAPSLLMICLYALNSAYLEAEKQFFISSLAPLFFNVSWILIAFWTRSFSPLVAARWLAIGVVLSVTLQWMVTSFSVRQKIGKLLSWKEWFSPRLFAADCRGIFSSFSLTILGVGALQINSALDPVFARFIDPSGPAFLWYAIRLQQLPLALFALALARAFFPSLSRVSSQEAFEKLLQGALKYASYLIIPSAVALVVFGFSAIEFLFGRGEFSFSDVEKTSYCLWAYAIGLVPTAYTLLLTRAFYAEKEYKIPALASFLSVVCNLCLNSVFVIFFPFGAFMIAFATSVAAFFNQALLVYFLKKRGKRVWPKEKGFLYQILFSSGVGALGVFVPIPWTFSPFFDQAASLVVKGVAALFLFWASLQIFSWSETRTRTQEEG